MVYLVTGSTGFIGAQICRALIGQGYKVRAFHRVNSPLTLLNDLDVDHAIGDLTLPETIDRAMQGVEVVFHTAAQLGSRGDPKRMASVTVNGTKHLLQAALDNGIKKVIHTSSVAALGVPLEPGKGSLSLMDEQHTWNYPPEWWQYGYTKYLAELEVQKYVSMGLDVVIINPSVVIGAGDINRVSGRVIIHVAKRHLPVATPGGLNAVHIEDVVRGHLAALKHGRRGERYIIGGENITHLDFIKKVAKITGVPAPLVSLPTGLVRALVIPTSIANKFIPLPMSGDTFHKAGYFFYYNTEKSKSELGLEKTHSLSDAINDAYTWYKSQKML